MRRRDFFKKTGLAALASGIALPKGWTGNNKRKKLPSLHPVALAPGATIGLIAPGSPISDEKIAKAVASLTRLGFKVKEGKFLRQKNGYLAGSDAERLTDLHAAFSDPEVAAVWCARGGYGCTRLLESIDYGLIKRNPKPFIGYSDITALHLAIQQRTGLVTFHGPVASSDFPDNTVAHLRAVLWMPVDNYAISLPEASTWELLEDAYKPFVITPGIASGILTGGNLSLMSAMVGTAFSPDLRQKIVFIEDVGEEPYRLDRMLTQLLQGAHLAQAAGIVLGVFSDCQPRKGSGPSWSLRETLTDRLGNLNIPVAYGFPLGHVEHQATYPYGILAKLDTTQGVLMLQERAVVR